MESNTNFSNSNNYWNTFKQIPKHQRSIHLKNNVNLKQVADKIEIPDHKYPDHAYIQVAGLKHHVYIYPKTKYSGIFLMLHGMDGHGGNSATLAHYLNQNTDLITIALDFRNYGKNIFDEHGYVSSVQILITDAEAIVDSIIAKYKPEKLFLGGVSMGGGIAFRMAINRPKLYSGIIMFAPSLRGNYENSPYLKKVGKVLGTLCPTWKFMNPSFDSGNRHSCVNEIKDQLAYRGKLIPGTIKSVLVFMQQNEKLFDKLSTPYLMVMGASDKIVDPFLAVDLDLMAKSTDKTTFIGQHMWHYIPLEPEFKTDIMPLITNWLNTRSK